MTESNRDQFRHHRTYPGAADVFSTRVQPLKDVIKACVFVLDTNVLLVPYTISNKGIKEIEVVYGRLIKDSRLVIPGQVVREFAKNRPERIKELYHKISSRRNQQKDFDVGAYPILEGVGPYNEVREQAKKLREALDDYTGKLTAVLEVIRTWMWDDPISQTYRKLFGDKPVVVDPVIEEEELLEDLKERYRNSIPPGYKDGGKEDDGLGDLVIWRTILDIAKSRGVDIVFVSGDEKADWFYRSDGQSLYPRFELVSEFQRAAPKRSLHIIKFHEMLEALGTDATVIEEVRIEEKIAAVLPQRFKGSLVANQLEELAHAWIYSKYGKSHEVLFQNQAFPDSVVKSYDGSASIGIEVLVLTPENINTGLKAYRTAKAIKESATLFDKFIVVMALSTAEPAFVSSLDTIVRMLENASLSGLPVEVRRIVAQGGRPVEI